MTSNQDIRLINLFVGIWFILFSMPAFFLLKTYSSKNKKNGLSVFDSLAHTFKNISNYKKVYKFPFKYEDYKCKSKENYQF